MRSPVMEAAHLPQNLASCCIPGPSGQCTTHCGICSFNFGCLLERTVRQMSVLEVVHQPSQGQFCPSESLMMFGLLIEEAQPMLHNSQRLFSLQRTIYLIQLESGDGGSFRHLGLKKTWQRCEQVSFDSLPVDWTFSSVTIFSGGEG